MLRFKQPIQNGVDIILIRLEVEGEWGRRKGTHVIQNGVDIILIHRMFRMAVSNISHQIA